LQILTLKNCLTPKVDNQKQLTNNLPVHFALVLSLLAMLSNKMSRTQTLITAKQINAGRSILARRRQALVLFHQLVQFVNSRVQTDDQLAYLAVVANAHSSIIETVYHSENHSLLKKENL
jgi:hypothetical protein